MNELAKLMAAVEKLKSCAPHSSEASSTKSIHRLKRAVELLRKLTLEDFKVTEWPRFCRLHEILEQGYGLPVPALSVCGEGTAEVRFTKLLAYYLDARNPHGLGGLLTKAIFEEREGIPGDLPFGQCKAEAEVFLGSTIDSAGRKTDNYLDLLVSIGHTRILVEQKINSAEGREQTPRYTSALESKFGDRNVHCFFLTPDGRPAKDKRWNSLSYADIFRRLGLALERHALSPAAAHNLRTLLWDLMLGPLAQDAKWTTELQHQVRRVAADVNRFGDLRRWFLKYGFDKPERIALLHAAGG